MSSEKDKYTDKTLLELKEILRARKMKVTGKKKDLIERLLFHDRTSTREEPQVEFHMNIPDDTFFKDIHQGQRGIFPPVTMKRMEEFLLSYCKKIDEKVKQLYKERYIRYIRSALRDEETFVTANIWAEMRKKISYKVDILINKEGVILETQCECAVGQGPSAHCKHVGTALHALTVFTTVGSIDTELTCTQVLQTFHAINPHRGSPIKARELYKIRGKEKTSLYDSRPHKYRKPEQIEKRLRDISINFQATHDIRMPILDKYEPANIYGIAHDHQYFMEDKFLDEIKVTKIHECEAIEVEEKSRKQAGCSAWRAERTKRITASNFGTICKATDRKDINSLVNSMTSPSDFFSKATQHGRHYESVAVEKFETVSSLKTKECGLFVSISHPMLAATPDRIINDDILVEVKCPHSASNFEINERTVAYLLREADGSLTLKKNHNYYYQVQGQLFCSKRTICKFIIYTFKDIKVIDIHVDKPFIKDMITKLENFFKEHFRQAILKKMFYHECDRYNFST